MTLISRSEKPFDGVEPESNGPGSGQRCAENQGATSTQGPTAVRRPMASEVGVMFSLLMRQMDRLRESTCVVTTENDEGAGSLLAD